MDRSHIRLDGECQNLSPPYEKSSICSAQGNQWNLLDFLAEILRKGVPFQHFQQRIALSPGTQTTLKSVLFFRATFEADRVVLTAHSL